MITNTVRIEHSLPGRTRFYISKVIEPGQIECWLRSFPGVRSAVYTQMTGSILVYHDLEISLVKLRQFIFSFLKINNPSEWLSSVWKQIAPIVSSITMFVANWYIQKSPASIMWKHTFHLGAMVTAIATSFNVIKDGILNLFKEKKGNANTLTAASIFASLYIGNPGSALVITIMSTISELLTEYTSQQTKQYIHSVLELDTCYAWKVNEEGIEEKVSLEEIQVGDRVVVFTGEKIPADGVVIEGYGTADESSITGEYMPKELKKDECVYAGSVLQNGHLIVIVEKVGDDTAISRIVKLLEEAQEKQAPIQNIADTLAEKMIPVSFGLALLTLLLTRNVNRSMNMLVIDFICGIKLSTATALYASIGRAAKKGAIVKGSHHIEEMSKLTTIILDKTGTITEGAPVVQHVIACEGYQQEDVIRFAATAEKNSSHPIADAIVKQASKWGIPIPMRDNNAQVETVVGKGISTFLDGKQIFVGSLRFMNESKIKVDHFLHKLEKDENVIYVAYDQTLIGVVSIFDKIRSGMHRTVQHLRKQGIDDIIMLTGDKRTVAREMARRLRLNWYHAEALPEDKATYVKHYGKRGSVMMVGDGINDAPALAHADVGVTMGAKRTDIASEASDVIITSDNPEMLSELVGLSRKTMNIIKQNFIVTFAINGLAILFGALGIFSPIVGAAIHNAATIGVVINSARILWTGDESNESKVLCSA
ncbi:heavy metal translocating P-type ATPase [Metabacillus sediminilitoris]|uniref:Cd(2+)-exporting ATPase n=1 Tax=Metabacillus sediminilitoris TaxID=2567941 RepID=A0A4S4BQH4_9BACI|nr:cation-translocating P-type ATPase [Metabacillus sediminilitoris]QGQ45696.1 cadmium-translocating P-type ATPase [Metabacillus sediminilitoris]THF77185.1 cadmium-translocating P-type ATPase [Metabacillus sediminilitoris]